MTASRGLLALSLLIITMSGVPVLWRLVDENAPAPLSTAYVGGFVGMLGIAVSGVIGGLETRIAKLEKERSERGG